MVHSRERKWLTRAAVGLGLSLAAAGLSGCGAGAGDCEEAYVGAISAVEGVESVTAECSVAFGGGYQRVDVYLDTNDDAETLGSVEGAMRAMAAEPGLEREWSTPRSYEREDGSSPDFRWTDLGFDRKPTIGEVREHYGIEPS